MKTILISLLLFASISAYSQEVEHRLFEKPIAILKNKPFVAFPSVDFPTKKFDNYTIFLYNFRLDCFAWQRFLPKNKERRTIFVF